MDTHVLAVVELTEALLGKAAASLGLVCKVFCRNGSAAFFTEHSNMKRFSLTGIRLTDSNRRMAGVIGIVQVSIRGLTNAVVGPAPDASHDGNFVLMKRRVVGHMLNIPW